MPGIAKQSAAHLFGIQKAARGLRSYRQHRGEETSPAPDRLALAARRRIALNE
jgi:hypothetical protein